MTNREAGINVVREMMGDQAAVKLSASADSNAFGAQIAGYAVDQVFADIWTRPGLAAPRIRHPHGGRAQ